MILYNNSNVSNKFIIINSTDDRYKSKEKS